MAIKVGQVQLALYTICDTLVPTQPQISQQDKKRVTSLNSWAKLITATFRSAVPILPFAKIQHTQKFSEKLND